MSSQFRSSCQIAVKLVRMILSQAYLLAGVRLLVELLEQEEEHDSVHSDPPDEGLRVVAVDEEKLESMQHDENELDLQTVSIFVYVTFRSSARCFIVSPFGDP